MKERRRHPRIPMTGWVEISGKGWNEMINGYVSNVSMDGIAVYTKEFLPAGTYVLLSLHFFGQRKMEFIKDLPGQIISSVKLDQIFRAGIRFQKEVTKESEPLLFSYLTR
jgi:hypothetical protein